MATKLKKELILISVVMLFILILAVTYASQNQSKNNTKGNNGNNGTLENETDDGNETWQNKTKEQNRTKTNNTFLPWQKRTEEECPEGCDCNGAVVSCETETGKIMTITAGNSGNVITLVMDKVEVNTTLEIEQEINNKTNQSKFYAKLSNGNKAEIKVMPNVAAERALERLRLKVCNSENNCTIELKEVGKQNQEMLAYEIQAERHVRVLGIFQAKAQERAEINAENGEVKTRGPWWMFLATKQD